MKEIEHFIDGKHYQPKAGQGMTGGIFNPAAASRKQKVYSPATGETIGEVLLADSYDVNTAVSAACNAFDDWSMMPAEERADILKKFTKLMDMHYERLARTIVREHGKSMTNAEAEILRGLDIVEYALSIPASLENHYSEGSLTATAQLVMRQPLGVIAGITLSNFPAMSAMWMFPVALVCGNTFVLKPNPETPSASIVIAELLREAGLPDGVFNVIQGDRSVTDYLIQHPEIPAISFSGSTTMANHVYSTCANYGKRVQTLGRALNHMVVMPDADIEQACDTLMRTAFIHAGESTMSLSVAIFVGDAGKKILPLLKKKVMEFSQQDGKLSDTQMPPITGPESLEAIRQSIKNGVLEGADILVDGRDFSNSEYPYGFWLGPSLFDNVSPSMRLYREEVFGPILSCMHVNTLGEAIKLVNTHESSNGASCFTSNKSTAMLFAQALEVGMAGINTAIPEPMAWHGAGGWKRSLFGDMNALGEEALRFYTRQKSITQFCSPTIAGGESFIKP